MPPFKDEHVLIIAPGSQLTAAQLGLPESFTPPRYRFPTRMFPGTTPGEWEPVKIRTKITTVTKPVESKPAQPVTNGAPVPPTADEVPPTVNGVSPSEKPPHVNGDAVVSEDVEMKEAPPADDAPVAPVAAPDPLEASLQDEPLSVPPLEYSAREEAPPADPMQEDPKPDPAQDVAPKPESTQDDAPKLDAVQEDAPKAETAQDDAPKAEVDQNEALKVEAAPEAASSAGVPQDAGVKSDPMQEDTAPVVPAPSEVPAPDPMQEDTAPADPAPNEVPPADPMQEDGAPEVEEETTETFEDDLWSVEGAVYPIQDGRIENWSCFFALLSHIYNMISPPFHMPVLFVAQPCWSARDHEMITQYVFENWKIPAFCLMDAALTATYAYGVPTALVLDVGHGKSDVTAVTDFHVNDYGRGTAIPGCGGRAMTQRLQQVLQPQGFDEDMAEQLKKSPICEILPAGIAYPQAQPVTAAITNPAAAASTGAVDSGMNAKGMDGLIPGQAPRGPGEGTAVGEEGGDGEDDDNEGVLDVAAIVARDNAAELLAKREKEKAEKAAAKKGGVPDAPKPLRLRNSERERASFTYVDYIPVDEAEAEADSTKPLSRKRKREVEVGIERFMAATPPEGACEGIIDTISEAIHHTILSVPDVPLRSALWENMIIVGNGSRVRGFTEGLLSVLNARYLLSPSTATIFTSELPSNFTTPVATPGTNTPIPGQGGHALHHPGGHGVNPLLVAATKNMMQPNQHLPVPAQLPPVSDPSMHQSHRGFSQTPTQIKTVKLPDYFPEWKDPSVSGMEEAAFLGAQVAAKVIFIVDQGNSKGFLTRSEYNDLGPAGIHECAM